MNIEAKDEKKEMRKTSELDYWYKFDGGFVVVFFHLFVLVCILSAHDFYPPIKGTIMTN